MSLPFGLKPDTIKPGAVRSMTSDKLATFSLGGTKKTPFQKHKEALEAKRKKEEEQTAAEYAQWVSDFEDPGSTKQFVKGDTINHGNTGSSGFGAGGGAGGGGPFRQPPGRKAPSAAVQSMFGQEEDIDGEEINIDGEPMGKAPAPAKTSGPPKISAPVLRKSSAPSAPMSVHRRKETKPSMMAEFMNELKQEQVDRESRGEKDSDRARGEPSSFDSSDPDTTNLYVGNMSPNITEEFLYREFCQYGPIQSVKVC
jgi:U2-associated protein SR140